MSHSGSCAPSARSPRRRSRSSCPTRTSSRRAWARCCEVVYLVFNEGYAASGGEEWMRPELCREALRLGRVLVGAAAARARGARPGGADGDPGVALSRARGSRRESPCCCATRTAPAGTGCWRRAAWPRSSARRRSRASGARRSGPTGCRRRSPPATPAHARPPTTDWERIVALYDALAQLTPSPVVELNRAVAVAMAFGPAGRSRARRRARRRAGAARLPPAAERARRPARAARPPRARRTGVRARRRAHPQRARAATAARPRRRLRVERGDEDRA